MMRLYPARWRRRYGDELDALLAETGADARVVADLLKGSVRMQFSTWSFLKLAVMLGGAGLFLGASFGFLLPTQYTSRATMQLAAAQISDDVAPANIANLNERIRQLEMQVLSRSMLYSIINQPDLQLYSDERRSKPLEDVIEEMKGNTRIELVTLPGDPGRRAAAFTIVFTYPDRVKAQRTVSAMVKALEAFHQYSQQRPVITSRNNPAAPLEVLEAASFPDAPSYPKRAVVMLGGFLAGLLVAVLVRVIRRTGFVARRFEMSAIVLGIAGLASVIAADKFDVLPYQYRSQTTMRLHGGNAAQVLALTADVLSRTTLSRVINDPRLRLYSEQLRTLPLEDIIQMMKRHLSVNIVGNSGGPTFKVAFDYPDRYKALMTVNAIMNDFEEANTRLYPSASATAPQESPSVLEVLDQPSLPVTPTSPNRLAYAVEGCGWGLLAAAVIAIMWHRWKPETQLPLDAVSGRPL